MNNYSNDASTAGFNAWLGSLASKPGQGISEFNLWLQDGVTDQANAWGENISITDFTKPITGIGPTGWIASVIDAPLAWGDAFKGRKEIVFSTTDPNAYIRPGYDGVFEFTAETSAVVGGTYAIWVGAGGDGVGDSQNAPGSVHHDEWSYDGTQYSSDPTDNFQRVITAEAVPEPATIIIWSLLGGLGIVVGCWRKRAA
jgi:hypothetical protein